MWDQLSLSELDWKNPKYAHMYAASKDQHLLYQFLTALHDDFEFVCGQLLHRTHLPSLDKAVFELVQEDTRLQTLHYKHNHTVLTAPPFSSSSSQLERSDKLGPSFPPFQTRDNNMIPYPSSFTTFLNNSHN